jgi:hypothetical protein
VLTVAITEPDLAGVRDVASVIHARMRQRTAGMVPLSLRPWSERVREVCPDYQQFVADLAAAMDERKERIGEYTAEHESAWATRALGLVPSEPLARLAW